MKSIRHAGLLVAFWAALLLGTSPPPPDPQPVFIPFDGQSCVSPKTAIVIGGFDKGMLYPDMPSLEEATSLVDSRGRPVPHTLQFGADKRSIILQPRSPLQSNETYTVSGIAWSRIKSPNQRPIRTDFLSGSASFEVDGSPKLLHIWQDYNYEATDSITFYLVFSEPIDLSTINDESLAVVTQYTQPISYSLDGTEGIEYLESVTQVEFRRGPISAKYYENFFHIVEAQFKWTPRDTSLNITDSLVTLRGVHVVPPETGYMEPSYMREQDAADRSDLDYYAVPIQPCDP